MQNLQLQQLNRYGGKSNRGVVELNSFHLSDIKLPTDYTSKIAGKFLRSSLNIRWRTCIAMRCEAQMDQILVRRQQQEVPACWQPEKKNVLYEDLILNQDGSSLRR